MATARRTILVLVAAVVVALGLLPSSAGASAGTTRPELGPLSPAFVEALHDPLVAVGLGRVPSPVDVTVDQTTQTRAARVAQPSAYDLRAEGRLTPVKDQDDWSTCWAFANIAAVESKLMSATPAPDPAPDYSEDNLVGGSGYGPVFPGGYDAYDYGGYDFMAVAYFARWAGPVNEVDDPYDGSSQAAATQKHVQGVTMIPGRATALDNRLVKQLVMQNGALSVGMYMAQGSYLRWSTDSYYCPTARGENHGVTIVGWDDSYPRRRFGSGFGRPPGNGAFLVRNTWGDSFGDGGYFWVSYYDKSFAAEQGLGGLGGMSSYSDVEDVDNYSRVYQYDKLGVTSHAGFRTTRVWGANRFTAEQTQTITAASFYTLASSTRYEVWAGETLKTLSKRASGVAALPGYVTVPLDTPLGVTAGRQFVVAIKLVSPGEVHPLAIEYPRSAVGATHVSAGKGQSFISRNGTTWTDLTTLYRRSNVCLKAFAQ
jgi:C1A family cysteine protease